MKLRDNVKTAFGNLRKRKFRTFLTSFAIAIGTMLIVTMVGLGVGLKDMVLKEIRKQASVTQIYVLPQKDMGGVHINLSAEEAKKREEEQKNSFKKITEEDVRNIRNINNVQDVQVMINAQITRTTLDGKTSYTNMGIGFDTNYSIFSKADIDRVRLENKDDSIEPLIAGRNLKPGDTNVVLAGQKYLKAMGIEEPASAIGKEITIICEAPQFPGAPVKAPFTGNVTIVGVVSEKFTEAADNLIMPIELAAAIQGYYNNDPQYLENKGPNALIVQTKTIDDVQKITEEIKKMGFGVENYQTVVDQVNRLFNIFQGLLAIGGIIVLFVASLGVINTMTMAIYERTRSIGIMKAVGASKRTIRNIFIMESAALGFIGGLMGISLGWFNTKVLGAVLNQYLKSKGSTSVDIFSIPLWLILGGLAFSIFISVIAGLYPAARASKLDPIQALRYE